MKKGSIGLIVILWLVLAFASSPQPSFAADDVDQYCEDALITSGGASYTINSVSVGQSFTPTKSTLTSVGLAINTGADIKSVTLQVRKLSDNSLAASSTTNDGVSALHWMTFAFDNLVLQNTQYKLVPTTSSTTAVWVFSDEACYAGGVGYDNAGPNNNFDYGFFTEAHGDFTTATTTPDSTTGSDTTSTTTTATSSTSTTISTPTTVKAEYDQTAKTVKVSWGESTTADISGYLIYRSTDKSKNYQKVGQTAKGTKEYSDDASALTAGEYYYIVKAYKNNEVSASSNVATVSIIAPTTEATTDPQVAETNEQPTPEQSSGEKFLGSSAFFVISIILLLILIALLVLLIIARKKGVKLIQLIHFKRSK